MPQQASISSAPNSGSITAPLNFQVAADSRPQIFVAPLGQGQSRRTAEYALTPVEILDGRKLDPAPDLDREGFALRRAASAVTDFYDEDQIRQIYYPEVTSLVRQASGARKVLVFDHTHRIDEGDGHNGRGLRMPVRIVHNDYTERSGPQRVRDLLEPSEAEAWLQGRFAVINAWRPIQGPVEMAPLALADARSVTPENLIATDLIYSDRVGEIYEVTHSPGQRWVHYPQMERDEVLLIKGYDSLADGRARFTPHTAFDDPATPAGAAARESIEIRTLVFY